MASFDENGKYIKTDWKNGDRITADKLNKIEESIGTVNDNDISRHVEADARLDALEAKNVAHDKELTNVKNDINRRSINVANLFTEKLTDDNTSEQFWNAFMYCLDNGYTAFVPRGTYIVKRWNPPSNVVGISDSYCLIIPNGLDVIFEQGVKFKLINDAQQWSRVVAPLGNNNLYGHFEIDGSADTITNGNEHMAGLFIYGKENIYIESLYSYNCYGDNVQLTGSESQGRNIIIDRLRCRKAGRKNLVFENTTNIHIKNAYLDNTEGNSSTWAGGGCLDIEPLSTDNDCYYKIDRLETTGTNDFTVGTKLENTPKFVLDIGTLVQHSGQLFSYALTINIGTAIFHNCQIYQLYSSHISIDNAIFRNQSKRIIDSYHSGGACPILSIKNLNVFGDSTVEHEEYLIFSQGANIYIGNAWIDSYNNAFIGTNTTQYSTVSFDNLYLNNVGMPGSDMSFLSTYGTAKLSFNVGNVIVKDNRETLPTCLFNIVTLGANDGMNVINILNDTDIQTTRSNYGNFTPVLTNGGTTDRRPTNPIPAEQYYDTTLNKPIWWDGTKWTDATGAEV